MAAHAATAPGRTLRGYPILLPKLSDPRLHLAAVITTLQVLGQAAFHFRLSIAQILLSLGTCAVLEVAITLRKQHVLMWPASALLTGNGVAFILRVPGTHHGDWWSLRGWWIYVATSAVSLLSKYVIQRHGAHIFNPSNIGLVLCFLALGRSRAEPLDFWWGPMSPWLGIAFAVIVAGGLLILSRLKLLVVAVGFWLAFAAGIGVLAATGHAMTARWHLGPIDGTLFWWVLLTSPEVLVFLFFMLTDPRTTPKSQTARAAYAVSVGLLAALLMAPLTTEFAHKVALLCALALVCAARPFLELAPRLDRRRLTLVVAVALTVYAGALTGVGLATRSDSTAAPLPPGRLPAITILPSRGVDSKLTLPTAKQIAHGLVSDPRVHAHIGDRVSIHLEQGQGQGPPVAIAQLAGHTYRLEQGKTQWVVRTAPASEPKVEAGPPVQGFTLTNVAAQSGLDFRQGSFRYGVSQDVPAMMGGGLCWLDYNNDGWLDLFVVNSYANSDLGHGALTTSQLFRNDRGRFVNVTKASGVGLPVRGEGCVAADLNGDGYTDLYVTTATDDQLLWNNGNGIFTEGARASGVASFGWHAGAAVADVNGDGRPDLFVAGYTEANGAIPGSTAGYPTNHLGVRDELFLNEGDKHFREVGRAAGIDPSPYDHSLGAVFTDVNGDGRPDLYVANDEDANRLYLNKPGGPLGFHFVDFASGAAVADTNAGMGIATADFNGDGKPDFFITNSRAQTNAAYASTNRRLFFRDVRGKLANLTGWGDSWIDLKNDGTLDLVLANGRIPVKNLGRDAAPVQVLTLSDGRFKQGVIPGSTVNGRGLAAADYDNDGRVDFAVNTVGGRLLLFHNTTPGGNWLEVQVEPFTPGAVVTVIGSNGQRQVREVRAGSSYLSSEDPRVHFGLGKSIARTVIVRFPDGTTKRYDTPPTNQLFVVKR